MTGAARTTPFLVTGRASFSPGFGTGGLGTGAALTVNGLLHAQCPDGGSACLRKAQRGLIYSVLVYAVPAGPGGRAGPLHHQVLYRPAPGQASPIELINFGESVNFPLLFGVALSLSGGHPGPSAAGQRQPPPGRWPAEGPWLRPPSGRGRRHLAGHRGDPGRTGGGGAAGHRRGQGGVAAVRHQVGVVPVEVVQAVPLVLLAAAVLAATNLLAILPALRAARSHPADLLRAE